MNNDVLISNLILGAVLIFVLWWVFGMIDLGNPVDVKSPILIVIKKDGFQPSLIQVPTGKEIKLHFLRTDLSACSEVVRFPQFNFAYTLPMHQKVEIKLPPLSRGEWDFSCRSGLFRGKIIAA